MSSTRSTTTKAKSKSINAKTKQASGAPRAQPSAASNEAALDALVANTPSTPAMSTLSPNLLAGLQHLLQQPPAVQAQPATPNLTQEAPADALLTTLVQLLQRTPLPGAATPPQILAPEQSAAPAPPPQPTRVEVSHFPQQHAPENAVLEQLKLMNDIQEQQAAQFSQQLKTLRQQHLDTKATGLSSLQAKTLRWTAHLAQAIVADVHHEKALEALQEAAHVLDTEGADIFKEDLKERLARADCHSADVDRAISTFPTETRRRQPSMPRVYCIHHKAWGQHSSEMCNGVNVRRSRSPPRTDDRSRSRRASEHLPQQTLQVLRTKPLLRSLCALPLLSRSGRIL